MENQGKKRNLENQFLRDKWKLRHLVKKNIQSVQQNDRM